MSRTPVSPPTNLPAAQLHMGRAKDTPSVKVIRRFAGAGFLVQPLDAGPLPAAKPTPGGSGTCPRN